MTHQALMSGRADAATRVVLRRSGPSLLSTLLCVLVLVRMGMSASPPAATVNSVLQELQAIESEAIRVSPASPLQVRDDHLAFQIRGIYQGVTNYYAEDRARYLALELIVANTSPEARTLDVKSIRLRTGGRSLSWQDRPEGIDGYSFQAGNEHKAIREVQPPELLAVPAGSTASTWLLFAGLELGGFVPDLTLEIPSESQPLALDIGLYERARLRQSVRRVGPLECLALVTVSGELNTVNAGSLANSLDQLAVGGVHRVVVQFDADALPLSQFLADWLRQAHQPNQYQHQFKQMPVFPVTLSELHYVFQSSATGEQSANVQPDLASAVAAALRSAFAAATHEEVIRSLRSPEPTVRAAALRYGATRLHADQLAAVQRFVTAPEPEVRRAALAALGDFDSAAAMELLVSAAVSGNAEVASTAIRSLASSRYPAAHAALARLIQDEAVTLDVELISVLSMYPRPNWQPTLMTLTRSPDSKVQQAALQAMSRLGDAQLLAILLEALQSADARVREEAFQRLANIESREADELALSYALERLRSEPPSASIRQFLERVRDQRAVPLLVRYLDEPETVRRSVIELLTVIGDQSVADEFVRRFSKFTASEQVLALQAFQSLDSPLGEPLAIAALRSDDVSLVQRAVEYLQQQGTDDVVAAMGDALRALDGKSRQANVSFLCNGLGGIGSPAARAVLLEYRSSADEQTRNSAQRGLQVLWNQSPARELVSTAELDLSRAKSLTLVAARGRPAKVDEETSLSPEQCLDLARKHMLSGKRLLQHAERIDAEYPELPLQQGMLHNLQEQPEAAIAAFRRAIELNSELVAAHIELGTTLYAAERFAEAIPALQYGFEHDASERRHQQLTSWALALVRIGRMEEAIDLVTQHAATFPDVPIFEYNVACLYGRSIELLRNDPDVAPNDPRFAVFSEEAVRLLQAAFEHDVQRAAGDDDMLAFMRADPDLLPLHNVSAFREFAELDLPEDQRRKPTIEPADPDSAVPGPIR